MEELKEQVRMIEKTEFVPASLRGKPHAILACILYGREIGLQPMESLAEVHMIDGRPSLSAKGKLKRAREAGHSVTGEVTADRAVLHGRRADNGDEMTVEYTYAEAEAAGLAKKANWQKHRSDMLWARAASRLCRRLFDDVPGALMLDPDEAELSPEERVSEAVGAPFAPPEDASLEEGTAGFVGAEADASESSADPSSSDEPLEGEYEEQSAFPIPEAAKGHVDHG